jgi:hypothetical protein
VPLALTLADCGAFLRGDYDDICEDACLHSGPNAQAGGDDRMTTFVLDLQDALHHERVEGVEFLVGREAYAGDIVFLHAKLLERATRLASARAAAA